MKRFIEHFTLCPPFIMILCRHCCRHIAPGMRVALLLISISALAGTKKAAKSLVTPVTDHKEFKKLLRTKTNVMVLFTGNGKDAGEATSVLGEVGIKVYGRVTLNF